MTASYVALQSRVHSILFCFYCQTLLLGYHDDVLVVQSHSRTRRTRGEKTNAFTPREIAAMMLRFLRHGFCRED